MNEPNNASEHVSRLHPCEGCGIELDGDDLNTRCEDCTSEQVGRVSHEHGLACAFGGDLTCPAFGESGEPRDTWWKRTIRGRRWRDG